MFWILGLFYFDYWQICLITHQSGRIRKKLVKLIRWSIFDSVIIPVAKICMIIRFFVKKHNFLNVSCTISSLNNFCISIFKLIFIPPWGIFIHLFFFFCKLNFLSDYTLKSPMDLNSKILIMYLYIPSIPYIFEYILLSKYARTRYANSLSIMHKL